MGKDRLLAVVGAVCALALGGAAPAQAALSLTSTFDSDNEGWETSQADPANFAIGPAGWSSGAIVFQDSSPGSFGFFASAPSWSGDATDNYGGTLSFHMTSSTPWTAGGPGVLVAAGGRIGSGNVKGAICLVSGTPVATNPGTGYAFTLDANHAYRSDCQTPAPENLVVFVLANLGELVISAEDGQAGETTALDDVMLSGGHTPPPYEVQRSLTVAYRKHAHAFTGALSQPEGAPEPACTTGRTVNVFKRRRGPDLKVGSAITAGSRGDYTLGKRARRGTYYAKSPRIKSGLAVCVAARSRVVRVR